MRSPALKSPSSQSASPKRAESWTSRSRMRSLTSGRRSSAQGLSPSTNLTVTSSRIGGSTVLSAANIQVIARARALASSGNSPRMVLGDVEDDRAGLEQRKIAFLIGRNQAERMKAQMRGFLLRAKRDKANLVGLAHLFQRPANARIARQALAAIGRPLKGGDDDGHREISSFRGEVHVHQDSADSETHRWPPRRGGVPAERAPAVKGLVVLALVAGVMHRELGRRARVGDEDRRDVHVGTRVLRRVGHRVVALPFDALAEEREVQDVGTVVGRGG